MANAYLFETVNVIDNNFSADSRDKDGKRVVSFDHKRTLGLHLSSAHIMQVEAVIDAKTGQDRGIISLSTGVRYISGRSAAEVCAELAKAL